jgi:hypothetical protein
MQAAIVPRPRRGTWRTLASALPLLVAVGCATGQRSVAEGRGLGSGSLPVAAHTVHVAPNGNDANAGTAAAPFATLEKARDAVRARRAASGPTVVLLHGGTYRLADTLTLGKQDSGTPDSPVIWSAAPNETVRLVGGVRLGNWQPVTEWCRQIWRHSGSRTSGR